MIQLKRLARGLLTQVKQQDAITELRALIQEQERAFITAIASGELHPDVANRKYLRLRKALAMLEGEEETPSSTTSNLFSNG